MSKRPGVARPFLIQRSGFADTAGPKSFRKSRPTITEAPAVVFRHIASKITSFPVQHEGAPVSNVYRFRASGACPPEAPSLTDCLSLYFRELRQHLKAFGCTIDKGISRSQQFEIHTSPILEEDIGQEPTVGISLEPSVL